MVGNGTDDVSEYNRIRWCTCSEHVQPINHSETLGMLTAANFISSSLPRSEADPSFPGQEVGQLCFVCVHMGRRKFTLLLQRAPPGACHCRLPTRLTSEQGHCAAETFPAPRAKAGSATTKHYDDWSACWWNASTDVSGIQYFTDP